MSIFSSTLLVFAPLSLLVASSAFGASPGSHQIKVTLFGQPCTLEGPLEESMLKTIHSVSPEQIYPNFKSNSKPSAIDQALRKLESSMLPNDLFTYKDQLTKRFQAELSFLSATESLQNSGKTDALLLSSKKYLPESKQKNFETVTKKIDAKDLTATQRKDATEQLFNIYNEAMPYDPEEEFHRAIHRMKVQYVCTFEESGDSEE